MNHEKDWEISIAIISLIAGVALIVLLF